MLCHGPGAAPPDPNLDLGRGLAQSSDPRVDKRQRSPPHPAPPLVDCAALVHPTMPGKLYNHAPDRRDHQFWIWAALRDPGLRTSWNSSVRKWGQARLFPPSLDGYPIARCRVLVGSAVRTERRRRGTEFVRLSAPGRTGDAERPGMHSHAERGNERASRRLWTGKGPDPPKIPRPSLAGTDQWNCSSSVDPVSAVTEEWPPWMTVVTSSK